jgi:alkylation response protein AidB-like acyl-CoA dehydrogenase
MSVAGALHKGGDWLIGDVLPEDVLTPERISDEHRLIGQTAAEFVAKEVVPALDELEQKNWTLARRLVRRSGELGLLGVDVPESFGGVALDKIASIVVAEAIGASASFATTFGAQTGLAIIPILCFGTDAQKQQYLPRIVSGELLGAYCLSESGAGSDALGARASARRQADGSWVLNGEKMWITNGGFADVFIVFAKVDGEHFSAFIVERGFPGVASGKEEHKMGLHGSSTTPVVLTDARVPAGNLLGEIGRGHKIAFNVLNYGRFKLAAMSTGGARSAIAEATAYAATRRQFGQAIASFGAIGHKLAEMSIRVYAVESALYRTGGLIDAAIGQAGHETSTVAAALEEYAIESSLLKVAGSEMLGYVVDENVQIHGGNGFVRDYPAERHYRDARVNRIFEGTNEINRLLVPGMLVKRALKGGLALVPAAKRLQDELVSPPPPAEETHDPLEQAGRTVAAMKKCALMALGLGMQTYGNQLADEQEPLMLMSDIIMDTFLAESAVRRAGQPAVPGQPRAAAQLRVDAATVVAHDAGLRVEVATRTVLAAMVAGDTLRTSLAALRRLLKVAPVNTVAARRRIAAAMTEKKGYPF